MTTRLRPAALLGGMLLALSGLIAPAPVAAADDFTLPFHNPGVALSYGMDRDRRPGYQLDWTGQLWQDTVPHWGRVYDQHTGLDYPMGLYSAVAAARSGTVVDLQEGFGTTQYGNFGNFVRVRHADGRDTLYYHLAQSGALVAVGQAVAAGQTIGQSGCSGLCNGAHLHFELLRPSGSGWQSVDPMADRLWTTWPGRVPFSAAYVRESNAGTVTIKRQATVTHWVEFRNLGGRTWLRDVSSGRLKLGTWSPAGRASTFRASDWPASWVPTYLDPASVAPDGTGRFTFGLRAAVSPGSYTEFFNLLADPLFWFDHARLGGYYVPIFVTSGQVQ
jgi:murein DD-endopeptidase MepM/ murein hydrolase activator NlpD